MTPTREQLIEEIAGKLWLDLCEGDGQHSESLDKALIRKHLDRLAACLAAPPQATPEPWCETFTPMTHFGQPTGDDACNDCGLPAARHPVATQEYERGYLDACDDQVNVTLGTAGSNLNVLWFKDSNGTVWTREPRR